MYLKRILSCVIYCIIDTCILMITQVSSSATMSIHTRCRCVYVCVRALRVCRRECARECECKCECVCTLQVCGRHEPALPGSGGVAMERSPGQLGGGGRGERQV